MLLAVGWDGRKPNLPGERAYRLERSSPSRPGRKRRTPTTWRRYDARSRLREFGWSSMKMGPRRVFSDTQQTRAAHPERQGGSDNARAGASCCEFATGVAQYEANLRFASSIIRIDGARSPQCGTPAPVRDVLANPRRHITPFRLLPAATFVKGTRWRTKSASAGRQADRTHDVEGRPGNPHRRGPSYCRRERRTADMATKRHPRRPRLEPSSMPRSLAFYDPVARRLRPPGERSP